MGDIIDGFNHEHDMSESSLEAVLKGKNLYRIQKNGLSSLWFSRKPRTLQFQ